MRLSYKLFPTNLQIWTVRRLRLASSSLSVRRESTTISHTDIAIGDYERYRNPSDAMRQDFRDENEKTKQFIFPGLHNQISREIQEAAATLLMDTVPELGPSGRYLYYTQDDTLGNRRYVREQISTKQHELALQISLQNNQLLSMSLSVEEDFLAYLVSPISNLSKTRPELRMRNVHSGREAILPVGDTVVTSIEWGPRIPNGIQSLFYTTSNSIGRPDEVWAMTVNSDLTTTDPIQVYKGDNDSAMVDVQRTKGCQYVAISASTKTSNEIYLIDDVQRPPRLVRKRQEGVQYHLDAGDRGDILILAHAVEPNHESGLSEELTVFQTTILELPLGQSFGTRLDIPNDQYVVTDMDMFQTFVALYERSTVDARQRIRVKSRKNPNEPCHLVPLPNPNQDCALLTSGGNMWYKSTGLRFCMETPCSPRRTYNYDVVNNVLLQLGQESDASLALNYVQRKILIDSNDGTHVPLSLMYRKDNRDSPDQRRPTVLIGYGAYGEPAYGGFDPTLLPLLDRGFTIAYAHTRGGGDLGRAWYRGGRRYNKMRSIEDYVACAKALVTTLDMTDSSMLFAKAFSAGGVLVGAALEKAPSLFRGVVLTNPFLDVAGSAREASWLTEHELDEWGDPKQDEKAAACISEYCPMSNVSSHSFPTMLLVGTIDDVNVPYWHPLMYASKIRRREYPDDVFRSQSHKSNVVYLHLESSGGHQMYGRRLQIASLEVSFILTVLDKP